MTAAADPRPLSSFDAVFLDLDGTLCRHDEALPGARQLVEALGHGNRRWAVLSNSTSSPARVAERLKRAGIAVDAAHVWTAAAASCDYVTRLTPGRRPRVFNLCTDDVDQILDGYADLVPEAGSPDDSCDAVIVGTPANNRAGPDRQRRAVELLGNGGRLIGTCADRVWPSPRGIEVGAGALTHLLAYATRADPFFCGKPEPVFFHELCHRLGVEPGRCVLIGDNLEADVGGAKRVDMHAILVLTGVTADRHLPDLPPEQRPDRVVKTLDELRV